MSNVRDAIHKLVLRGNITLVEFSMFNPNEDELQLLIPRLDDDALLAIWPIYMGWGKEKLSPTVHYLLYTNMAERLAARNVSLADLAASNAELTQKLTEVCDICLMKV